MNQQEEYQFYGSLRRPRQTYSFNPQEEEGCSSSYYNLTTSYENDTSMLEDLECFDSEVSYEEYIPKTIQESRHSSPDLFHSQVEEDFDEDTFMEIEPLQLDEEIKPLPSNLDIGKYLSEALEK